MTWVQEKGDLKALDGSWEFTELDGGRTKATFSIEADPGRMLGMLLRGPAEGKVKEFLTKGAAEGLKQQVESSRVHVRLPDRGAALLHASASRRRRRRRRGR